MGESTTIFCPTPKCVTRRERWPQYGNSVCDTPSWVGKGPDPEFIPVARCQHCGGYVDEDGNWLHQCVKCGENVEPGELVGLFVPHACAPCKEKQRQNEIKAGHVCSLCRKPYCDCCC